MAKRRLPVDPKEIDEMNCPNCSTEGAYQGITPGSTVECLKKNCKLYSKQHAEAVCGAPKPLPPPPTVAPVYRGLYAPVQGKPHSVVNQLSGVQTDLSAIDCVLIAKMMHNSYRTDGNALLLAMTFYDVLQHRYPNPTPGCHTPGNLLDLLICILIKRVPQP